MIREEALFVLQHADETALDTLYQAILSAHTITTIQPPTEQTLMQPVVDPISDSEFFIGEVLTTTTIVAIDTLEHKGWAMVMDSNEERSLKLAVIDGCIAKEVFMPEITSLYEITLHNIQAAKQHTNKQTHSTKVQFDLMN